MNDNDYKLSLIRGYVLEKEIDPRYVEMSSKICKFHNIQTISDLDRLIKQNNENLINFMWFMEKNVVPTIREKREFFSKKNKQTIESEIAKSKPQRNLVRRGISIWILGYVILCSKNDIEIIDKYLKYLNLSNITGFKEKLIEFCSKIKKKIIIKKIVCD